MSASARQALLIINPGSCNGAEADMADGLRTLEAAGMNLLRVESSGREETVAAIESHHNETDLVIIAGGDGTISSAAEALHRHKLPLAVLPLGTANDLARSLGLNGSLGEAFQAVVEGHLRPLDLGIVNGHYFFNAANIGLGVRITRELTPEGKKKWGVLSYLKAVCISVSRRSSFRVTIIVDGREHCMLSIHLAVGNNRYYGGGNLIDEDAELAEGRLHLYSIRPSSLWELLTLAPLLRRGTQWRSQRTFTTAGHRIKIRTRSPMEIHADGEPIAQTPATFEVIPAALQVIVPRNAVEDNRE